MPLPVIEDTPPRAGPLASLARLTSNIVEGAGTAVELLWPAVSYAIDYAWFLGATGLLLALPVLVEIQRETTVLVIQKQREAEMASVQEQAKNANAGVVDQLKGLGTLIASASAPSS
jgi:hypothetical protein